MISTSAPLGIWRCAGISMFSGSTSSSFDPCQPPAPNESFPPIITSPPPMSCTYAASIRSCRSSSPPIPRGTFWRITASYPSSSTGFVGKRPTSRVSSVIPSVSSARASNCPGPLAPPSSRALSTYSTLPLPLMTTKPSLTLLSRSVSPFIGLLSGPITPLSISWPSNVALNRFTPASSPGTVIGNRFSPGLSATTRCVSPPAPIAIGWLSSLTSSRPLTSVTLVERMKISTVNGSFSRFHVGATNRSMSTSFFTA
jgi:hypothetical protein